MPPELVGPIKTILAGSASSFPVVMVPVAPPTGSSVQGTSISMALTSMSGPLLVMKTSMSKMDEFAANNDKEWVLIARVMQKPLMNPVSGKRFEFPATETELADAT
jgi:hypothetical protein